MRFESNLPDDSVNMGEGTPVREAGLLVIGVVVTAILVTTLLALFIEALVPLVPPSLEVRLFSEIVDLAGETEESEGSESSGPTDEGLSTESDPEAMADRVQVVLDRLAAHWLDSPYPAFHAFVIDDPLPNAFALPGGAIGVTTGLLERVETENELAFILGHELGHFAGRDHLRGLGRGLAISVVWMALGLSGDQVEGLTSAASAFSARHFDRNQESDADLFGARLLATEYGHAAGTRAVFERVLVDPSTEEGDDGKEAARRDETPGSLERLAGYLSTHPLGPDRIRALDEFIEASGWDGQGEQLPWKKSEGSDPEVETQNEPNAERSP